jgi:hypothetical protein
MPVRPHHYCHQCPHTWFSRGSNRSLRCPNCQSRDIGAYAPPPPVDVIGPLLDVIGSIVIFFFTLALKGIVFFAKAAWAGAVFSYELTAPVRGVLIQFAQWTYSVKDDLLSDGTRNVNAVQLIGKLLVIILPTGVLIVLIIRITQAII